MPLEPGTILERASDLLRATCDNDAEAMVGFYAPDGVVRRNCDDRVIDPAPSAKSLAELHRRVPDLSWDDVVITTMPAGSVIRSVRTGTTASGADVRIHTRVVAALDADPRSTRTDEYLDSAAHALLLRR